MLYLQREKKKTEPDIQIKWCVLLNQLLETFKMSDTNQKKNHNEYDGNLNDSHFCKRFNWKKFHRRGEHWRRFLVIKLSFFLSVGAEARRWLEIGTPIKGTTKFESTLLFFWNKLLFAPFTWAKSNVINTDAGCEIEISWFTHFKNEKSTVCSARKRQLLCDHLIWHMEFGEKNLVISTYLFSVRTD